MNQDFLQKKEKKEPLELQLTAMIDVFSMIVIFLIFGTVFGAADMVIPPGIEIPKSISKEGIESAPRVAILKNEVTISLLNEPMPLSLFRSAAGKDTIKAKLKNVLAPYVDKKKDSKSSVIPLNFLADQDSPYAEVFDVIVVFRELGFNSILFVANGGGGVKK